MYATNIKYHNTQYAEVDINSADNPNAQELTALTTTDGIDNAPDGYLLAPNSTVFVPAQKKLYVLDSSFTWNLVTGV